MNRQYTVTLTAKQALMMHRDNLEHKALVDKWQRDPQNRDLSVPGDDRSPAWTWLGSLYHDTKRVALQMDSVMAACMGAGAEVKAPRGRKSLKAQTQSGMAFTEPFLEFTTNGGSSVPMAKLTPLIQEQDFEVHLATARELGFDLDVRRARIGMAKHVRVRPIFYQWQARGVLNVWDDTLTSEALETIFHIAGDRFGLCEWRPGGRRPGPFGTFKATLAQAT